MTGLPIVLSVPHGGRTIPSEISSVNMLTESQIIKDGDEFSLDIYQPLKEIVESMLVAQVARAYVDLNRAPSDIRRDGVVKTHTVFNEPIYSSPLSTETTELLIRTYHVPYFEQLRELASCCRLGIDCHTMLEFAPTMDNSRGEKRPKICISNAEGSTCSNDTLQSLSVEMEHAFECEVASNIPFKGGHICRSMPGEIPWLQLEISRSAWMTPAQKGQALSKALQRFSETMWPMHTSI